MCYFKARPTYIHIVLAISKHALLTNIWKRISNIQILIWSNMFGLICTSIFINILIVNPILVIIKYITPEYNTLLSKETLLDWLETSYMVAWQRNGSTWNILIQMMSFPGNQSTIYNVCANLRVIIAKADMQANDEMSRVILCSDKPNSTILLIHSPNPGTHCSLCNTSPVQNMIRSSFGCTLQNMKCEYIKYKYNGLWIFMCTTQSLVFSWIINDAIALSSYQVKPTIYIKFIFFVLIIVGGTGRQSVLTMCHPHST